MILTIPTAITFTVSLQFEFDFSKKSTLWTKMFEDSVVQKASLRAKRDKPLVRSVDKVDHTQLNNQEVKEGRL